MGEIAAAIVATLWQSLGQPYADFNSRLRSV